MAVGPFLAPALPHFPHGRVFVARVHIIYWQKNAPLSDFLPPQRKKRLGAGQHGAVPARIVDVRGNWAAAFALDAEREGAGEEGEGFRGVRVHRCCYYYYYVEGFLETVFGI